MPQNPDTVKLLTKLKKKWKYEHDKDVAERLGMTPQEYSNMKGKSLTKMVKGLLREVLKNT